MGERGCDLRGSGVSRRDDGLPRSGDEEGIGVTSRACGTGTATPRGAGGGITTAGADETTEGAPEIRAAAATTDAAVEAAAQAEAR